MNEHNTRCGFIALIGETNAGKSTLLNTLIGEKISIVTHKINTTRRRILGILCKENTQCIFMDTPGIMGKKDPLNKALVQAAHDSLADADITAVVVDAVKGITQQLRQLIERAKRHTDTKLCVVLNKVDQVEKSQLLSLAEQLHSAYPEIDEIFMTSALKNDGTIPFIEWLINNLPQGPWLYDEDQISDLPMRETAAEITREKLFLNLHQELPYGLYVSTDRWRETSQKVDINQTIFVNKKQHKPMVIGHGGSTIKRVGIQAREELEKILDKQVRIELFVKIKENWADNPSFLFKQS